LIEGTLELSELYSCMKDTYSPNDIPQPVLDDNPDPVDIYFMRKAREVANKSPDESTKVRVEE
jgi:hypothetical protein